MTSTAMNQRNPEEKSVYRSGKNKPHVVVANIMRREGGTGLQTHSRMFISFLESYQYPCTLVTPYDAPLWQVYPVFGMRKLIEPFNSSAGVWWHDHWHAHFLEAALRKHLRRNQDCVVYAQCPPSACAALKARQSPAQRVVMAVHFNRSQADEWVDKGMILRGGRVCKAIVDREREVLLQLDGLVFVSEFMRRELLSRHPGLGRIPYVVIPNFIPDPGLQATASIDADLISIGTLEPRKNQGYLLDVIAAAHAHGTALRLTIVGDGPDRATLESKARKLRIAHLVRFAGFVGNAAQMLSRHRAYVHAARLENMPLTLIEALSRSLPVFAPAVGGIPEIFDDGVEGRFLPLDNANNAALTILEWLRSPQQMKQAAMAARSRFLSRFQSPEAAIRLAEFITSVGSQP